MSTAVRTGFLSSVRFTNELDVLFSHFRWTSRQLADALMEAPANIDYIQLLLAHGADPNEFHPPCTRATLMVYIDRTFPVSCIRPLLDAKADPNVWSPHGIVKTFQCPLALARNVETIDLLIEFKADVNAVYSKDGVVIPIYYASRALHDNYSSHHLQERLLYHGHDPNALVKESAQDSAYPLIYHIHPREDKRMRALLAYNARPLGSKWRSFGLNLVKGKPNKELMSAYIRLLYRSDVMHNMLAVLCGVGSVKRLRVSSSPFCVIVQRPIWDVQVLRVVFAFAFFLQVARKRRKRDRGLRTPQSVWKRAFLDSSDDDDDDDDTSH